MPTPMSIIREQESSTKLLRELGKLCKRAYCDQPAELEPDFSKDSVIHLWRKEDGLKRQTTTVMYPTRVVNGYCYYCNRFRT